MPVHTGQQIAQTFMRSLVVVIQPPDPSHSAYLAQAVEQIGIQELSSHSTVKAFSKAVLLRLAFLDVG